MRKLYSVLALALLILGFFISCEFNPFWPTTDDITITLSSGIVAAADSIIETREGKEVNLPSGDTLWETKKYAFLGWAKTKNGDASYKAGAKFSSTADTILYAVWIENPKITYLPNGGKGEAVTEYHKSDEKVVIKKTSFTKEGCTLSYWSKSANGYEIYTFGQEITLTKDLTLYAVWVKDEKSVTIELNPGIIRDKAQTISASEGEEIVLPSGDSLWAVSGYTFSGWAETAGGDVKYKAGGKYSAPSATTLYAIWEKNMATLTYNADGGEGSIESVRVLQGTEVTLADEDALSRDGYILSSWTDGTTNYDLGSKLTLFSNITLYAVWTEKYNIKYYNGTTLIRVEYPQGSSTAIGDGNGLAQKDSKLYWTTNSDGTGTSYDVGEEYNGAGSISLYAQWQEDDGTLSYTLNQSSKTYSVKASDPKTIKGEVTIPETYKGKKVAALDDLAFAECSSVTKITIPNTVNSIGGGAFYDCSYLTSVNIPEGITELKAYVEERPEGNTEGLFGKCWSLTEIIIPKSVTVIGDAAFSNCNGLKSVTIKGEVTAIGSRAFWGCCNLESFIIPDTVTSIGDNAFYDCEKLTSISIPSSITTIGNDAFKECKNLTEININKAEGSITGSPWGAPSATIKWGTST